MKSKILLILGFVAGFSMAGCAQTTATRATSGFEPGWRGGRISSLVVKLEDGGPRETAAVERTAVDFLRANGVEGWADIDIAAGRNKGETIRRRAILNTGAEGLVLIRPVFKDIIESYGGGYGYSDYPYYGAHHGSPWHNEGRFVRDPVFYETPSLILREPEARYQVTLYALPHFEPVWSAEMTVRGPTGMEWDELGARFAEQMVKRMRRDGVI